MAVYRENEKKRHIQHSASIFGSVAGQMQGTYNGIERPFCLPDDLSSHNLHESIRQKATDYFLFRKIPWHDGHCYIDPKSGVKSKSGNPSNHVCCSQSQCVNALFPFRGDPDALRKLLSRFGFDVSKCLPVLNDHGQNEAYVGFEWIGLHNYLMEYSGGQPARCNQRTRGANFTSADFIFRYKSVNRKMGLAITQF